MSSEDAVLRRSQLSWGVLCVLLLLESLFMVWALCFTVIGAMGDSGALMQDLSLIVIIALALVWVVLAAVGAFRTKASWVRGSALTIHVLLFATGTGVRQLQLGPDALAIPLLLAGILGFAAALLARPAQQGAAQGQGAAENSAN